MAVMIGERIEVFPRHGSILSFFPARSSHNICTVALAFAKEYSVGLDKGMPKSFRGL